MEIKYFKDEKDAKDLLAKIDKKPKKWCPLTREMCRVDCLCYVEAHTTKVSFKAGVSKYRIVEGYCDNLMFS